MTFITGRILALFATGRTSEFVTQPVSALALDAGGIPGDRHNGLSRKAGPREPWLPRGCEMRNDRQLSALCADELADVAYRLDLPVLSPHLLGANLLITGLPGFSAIAPGARLAIGGAWGGKGVFDGTVVLTVEAYNRPCRKTGQAIAAANTASPALEFAFIKAAKHQRGLVLSVSVPGRIAVGDTVVLLPPVTTF